MKHPRDVLQEPQAAGVRIPVCDHYSGVAARMKKSLQLQAEMTEEFGLCVFDVTLDCEDGAAVGGESEHASLVAELLLAAAPQARVAARVHPVDHRAFADDVQTIAGRAGHRLCHLMVPKVESVRDVDVAVAAVRSATTADVPMHVLIESPAAVHRAFDIAAHPAVQSVSFGLMDFVAAHGGAIPSDGMGAASGALGQFGHPLVVRAKLEIASACHASGKVPSHCVVTEFNDADVVRQAARRAAREFGYSRMWSIHPAQIRPILDSFAPDEREIELATEILLRAQKEDWAPVSVRGRLHDRASYRHFWQLIQRAHQTGQAMPAEASAFFVPRIQTQGAIA